MDSDLERQRDAAAANLRWRCPHCKGEPVELLVGLIHIAGAHDECWSCKLDQLVLRRLILHADHFVTLNDMAGIDLEHGVWFSPL